MDDDDRLMVHGNTIRYHDFWLEHITKLGLLPAARSGRSCLTPQEHHDLSNIRIPYHSLAMRAAFVECILLRVDVALKRF